MKRLSLVVLAGTMAFLLSSCFALQSFSLLAGALKRGESTKAVFVVRPFSSATTPPISHVGHQFVLIGVNNPADVLATNAIWNVNKNKKFAPKQNMPVSGAVAGAIGTQCDMSGFTYSTISGFTWKGFITLNAVNDKRLVGQTVVIQVGLKAKPAATHHDNVSVIGLTGEWQDTSGDGIVNGGDSFYCSGNGSSFLFIK